MINWEAIGRKGVTSAIKVLRELKEVKAFNNELNIKTDADIISNNKIKEILTKSGASCDFVSEEDEEIIKINGGNKKVQVVVDPVDYTHFFLRGELSFCSVALMVLIDGFPKYSFVGSIANNDMYHCDEKSAYKNNQKITVPIKIQGKNIIVGYAPYKFRAKKFVDGLADLTEGNYFIYNFGGQLHAAKIADGIYDALIEVRDESLHEFAGAVIAERAGGVISTLEGKPIDWNPSKKQTLLIARNKKIKKDILNQFKKYREF
ncbi:MAG: inositol monophosphatase family protein [Nanoarchaeota archaeon]|nr:inositol monophosphatase family protein [Nanoarchaeota archaeon]